MLSAWLNTQVTIQRRPAVPSRNSLGEPDYGTEASYPAIYTNLWVRIEYPDMQAQFTETGERIALASGAASGVDMYVEPEFTIQPEDRVTITTSPDPALVGQLYLAHAVYPEYGSLSSTVHHHVVELQIH